MAYEDEREPSEGSEPSQEDVFAALQAEVEAEEAGRQDDAGDAGAADAAGGEGKREPGEGDGEQAAPTVEELQAQIAQLRGEVSTKDKALHETRKGYQDLAARIAGAQDKAAKDKLIERLERARKDPDEADRLLDELHAEATAPPSAEEIRREARTTYGQQIMSQLREELGLGELSEEERGSAYARAKEKAGKDGRPAPHFTEVLAAETSVLKERELGAAGATQKRLAELEQQLAAMQNQETGQRLREAGGPEESTPGLGRPKVNRSRILDMSDAEFEKNLDDILEDEAQRIAARKARR